ncbi:MAG: DegT/DnrJ/EryC1/StrS family aminotransferase [Candidatus Abyssobacteria bacterium SURF_17]|uniref:DegT/DnrJ/EryC1/StrS family aminotransferase n=1 Tax=Candidatus Abyssobacteria bacterium SURF_17 TaxID=2093361 RepID=A0A419EYC4_9BACT|nr:MAG: DegT/DnrJ/EryC1/StrS family aminotransferase [Candidatus Abyssubacteria bacterium SURF_17]
MKKAIPESSAVPARIPLCKPYLSQDEEIAALEVLRSGWLMQGEKVSDFERLVAGYVGVNYAVAVNSGTSALLLALLAVNLKAGDKIIMPSHSFVATANSAVLCGGEPVFADIGQNGYTIDPAAIGPAIDSQMRALMVVHQIGYAAEMDRILSLARQHGLAVVEDAACSLGSSYRGRQTGSFGEVACLSFHPRKVITTGEGGMVLTDSEEIGQTVRCLRNHGLGDARTPASTGCLRPGFNYRLTDVQAAIGIAQFGKLHEILRLRRRLAARYREILSGISALWLPAEVEHSMPNYQSFAVEVADTSIDRDALIGRMTARGIECRPGIQPIHLEPAYADKYGNVRLPETMRAARNSFFLPLYPAMTEEEQDIVIHTLKDSLNACRKAKGAQCAR